MKRNTENHFSLDFTRGDRKGKIMLWTIIGILIVLWILGLLAHIAGGFIHILLVIAVIIFIIKLIKRI